MNHSNLLYLRVIHQQVRIIHKNHTLVITRPEKEEETLNNVMTAFCSPC